MTSYAIPLWDMPAVPVTGSNALFPVRHIYCVTRNYDPSAAEPGGLAEREVPAIFTKAPGSVLARGGDLPYPAETERFEPEIELVIAIGEGGSAIPYRDEDPFIRKEYEEELAKEGVPSRMEEWMFQ